MQNVEHVIISCAGLGSRLGLNKPKCLVEIGGRALIDYQLDLLKDIPDIRIVVGFMEEELIEHVRSIHPNVTFIRNPDYRTTTNAYSLYLASAMLKEPFLIVDGDLLIDRQSFHDFVRHIDGSCSLIGITPSKTEEAVFVLLDDENRVTGFRRQPRTDYEWSGIAYLKDITIHREGKYVFSEIEPHLPVKAEVIKCFEIDTPEDMDVAIRGFKTLGY
ncbi:NTP transferase domain-containing protein [Odoribacter sp. Z80]|uniref:phosphocholine cytidylyltransferase family protein n=1 Tax=Odoribacter sp. Z80 TaxID=2304575 RepID=UPI001379FA25|nr:NTP transferase domain-containing protein [Odoribacter sp. Z80]NCE71932.1 nucleotidyltransferase [Odoribacter sp. Z80]